MTMLSFLLVALNGIAQPPQFNIKRHDIDYYNGRILVDYRVVLDVSAILLKQRLNDFEKFSALSPLIKKSTLKVVNNKQQITQVLRPCLLGVCYSLIKNQIITHNDKGATIATVIPEQGHFESGYEEWFVESVNDTTILHYRADLTPDFVVPPIIGPMLIRKIIHQELSEIAVNLIES